MSSSHEIFLTSSPDGPIIAYDASSGAILARFTGSRSPRQGLALAGNTFLAASHISSATASGSIHLYNWWSSTVFRHLPLPEPVAPLTASRDGLYLFAGGLSGNIHALSLPSGNLVKSIPAHDKPVSCLKINDDGSLLISGSDDGTIVVVPIFSLVQASASEDEGNFIMRRFEAHADSVADIASGMGPAIISCSLDCSCKFWDLLRGVHLRTVAFPCTIFGVALDPTDSEFYAGGSDGFVYKGILKVGSKQLVNQGRELVKWSPKHDGAIVSVVMMNEGQNLVSAADDGSVWIWEVATGQVLKALRNDDMGSISDMVVATGLSHGRGHRAGTLTAESGGSCRGISARELSLPIKQTLEMEDMLSMVGKDMSRAIDMLESAINNYERLLELILKEAKGGSTNSSE